MLRAWLLGAGALLLALASSGMQRRGPDLALFCGIGPPEASDDCPKPRLNGGWPAPYLFDTPGVSVEWKLNFGEDEFRSGPFAADVAFDLLLLGGLAAGLRRLRRRS